MIISPAALSLLSLRPCQEVQKRSDAIVGCDHSFFVGLSERAVPSLPVALSLFATSCSTAPNSCNNISQLLASMSCWHNSASATTSNHYGTVFLPDGYPAFHACIGFIKHNNN